MPLIEVIVLATVQGITEFLPISSTAHLALIPWLLRWNDPGLAFDVALHVGTLVAVLLYFLKEWVDLTLAGFGLKPLFASERSSDQALEFGHHRALIWFLAIATIPAGVAGWLFHEQVETTWRSPFIIAAAMILVAIVMAWGEKAGRQEKGLESVGLADSLWIGFSQAIALVPGVSRSGITITGGLFRGLKRETAARFSFLLSTPVIAGAALKELHGFPHHRVPEGMGLPFGLGIVISALVGYATIAYFLKYLQFGTFKIFIYYRFFFGIIVLALAFFFHLGSGF
jgi:undecaprenyl-diphosphatase